MEAPSESNEKKRSHSAMSEENDLDGVLEQVMQSLSTAPPQTVHGLSTDELTSLYTMPPFVPKPMWTQLGDCLKQCEQIPACSITGDNWFTLRSTATLALPRCNWVGGQARRLRLQQTNQATAQSRGVWGKCSVPLALHVQRSDAADAALQMLHCG